MTASTSQRALEKLADPGGIWVARNVYNQVKSKLAIEFDLVGDHLVKNIPEPVSAFRVLLAPSPAVDQTVPPLARPDPAEAARQGWLERAAATASYFADLSRQSEGFNSLLEQMRAALAANELITGSLWSLASAAADLLRVEDEIEEADLRAGAISPKNAKRRLAEAGKKRAAAKRRVRAALEQLRARIGELGGP